MASKTDLTLYWDPNFVSSQQIWLIMRAAQIDATWVQRAIFSGDVLTAQDDDLPKGLWLPVYRDAVRASEGLERCFLRLMDDDGVKKLRGPAWLDGRAYGLCKKVIACENHLLLIEGEFLYRPQMHNLKKIAPYYAENIHDDFKATLMQNIILSKISPKALKLSLEYIHDNLVKINAHLGFQLCLNADEFGLADILWLPFIRRLHYMGWPLKNYSEILPWYQGACSYFTDIHQLDALENLPSKNQYGLWQKISWLGSRDLLSSLKLMGINKKVD